MSPTLIIIDGQNGAGKSTVARLLHKQLPFTAFIHWDTIKKLVSDFEPNDKYHGIASEVMRAMTEVYLRNGVSVLYEGHFGTATNLNKVAILAKEGVRLLVYQIEAPFEVRKERIRIGFEKGDRKRLLPDEHIIKNDKRYEGEKYRNAKVFDSSVLTTEDIVREILDNLKT